MTDIYIRNLKVSPVRLTIDYRARLLSIPFMDIKGPFQPDVFWEWGIGRQGGRSYSVVFSFTADTE